MKTLHLIFSLATALVVLLSAYAANAQSSIELNWSSGPYIDFKNNNVDYDVRFRLTSDNELSTYGGSLYQRGQYPFKVDGDIQFVGGSGNSTWLMHTPDNGSGIMYIGHDNKGTTNWKWDYQFRQTHFYAKAASIGTGTLPSGYKLAVDGKIMAEEVHVQSSAYWPDYVFAPEYELMSLEETNAFIKENSHLPGIPSAAEVEAEGFDLAEMNKLLLKKIEELTLHTIEQQKEIEALKEKVQ